LKKTTHILLRILKICGITIISVLIILFLAPYLFPDTVGNKIKQWTNQSIKGELNFSKARLSFFTHFPSLTLTLYNVDLNGSSPFEKDTLLSAEKLGFGINIKNLIFDHKVNINKLYLTKAYIHVLVNKEGQANYNIYKSDSTSAKSGDSDSSASLHLEKIVLNDSRILYSDMSIPVFIQADHFFYEGTGDLDKSVFGLKSHIQTDSLSFVFENQAYVKRKAIDATLITQVNTKTLALIFDHNLIKMNKLNLVFSGRLDFLKNGYAFDFQLGSSNADLYQLITIFPPEYLKWLQKTKVKGIVDFENTLKGKYIASTNELPDYTLKLKVHDGFISYQDATIPVSNLTGIAEMELPGMDPEKLHTKIDSFSFHLDKDFIRGELESQGLSEPRIRLNADAQMNLQNLKKALGISSFDMEGQLSLHARANGKYSKKVIKTSLRNRDTVISSIPAFDLTCTLNNGFIKYYKVAQPISSIFLKMNARCPDSVYSHAFFNIDTLHAAALHDFIEGKAVVHASKNFPVDIHMNGYMDLSDIKQLYPLDSLLLSGILNFKINSTGKYAPEHHLLPNTTASFSLKNGSIQTRYYPHPINKINIEANVTDATGNLKGLHLDIRPAALVFENKSFQFQGVFNDFEDLNYNILADGELDLGRIYQVFARKDLGLNGSVLVHANFKGKQSDATGGRYNLLSNSGSLEIKNLVLTHEYFPKPFLIKHGIFRFDQDKMWFDTFLANYGKSDLVVNGYIENVINYILSSHEILKANFDLKANTIDVNEFSVYAGPSSTQNTGKDNSGVVLIPANLDLTIKAAAEKVLYNDLSLNHFQGGLLIKNGALELSETGFELIGTQVSMKGKYAGMNPQRASFEFQMQAKDFDIQRAYREIKLFHDLASSAQHAFGIISLDYTLNGKLNEKMYPVYPSLNGGGILSVKNLKMNGWNLMNSVSTQTEKTELTNPDLSKIEMKSTIKNNLITIQKMKFKAGSLRIKFEGQTSFDNQVNFKMRIGLPPLGLIGIPIRITGNANNPKIKMTKTDSDPLEEKEEAPADSIKTKT